MIECMLTENRCYKTKQTIKPKGVMVHSTGANNPNLRRYVQPSANDPNRQKLLSFLDVNFNHNDWNRSDLNACVHAFIGKLADGSVATAQTLPWNHRGWHAGKGTSGKSANDTHISFEICEDNLTDSKYFSEVYHEAVMLTSYLCAAYDLNPLEDGVVICHSEGYDRGIASNHGDVMNWFPKHGKTMADFRRDVANNLKGDPEMPEVPTVYRTLDEVPEYYRAAISKVMEKGALKGTGNGEINVSEDFCRTMTVLDRLGKLD